MNLIVKNKTPIFIAFIQWFLTTVFQIDRLFFSYGYECENKYFITTKALYFIFLAVIWCFGFDAYKKIKSGNEYYQRGFYIFKIYLILMLFMLLILWPGTWAWDDLWILNAIAPYNSWLPWQHIITGIYQDVLLQILPFPGGIILLQNIIISICVAFSVTKLEVVFHIKKSNKKLVDTLIKLFPFLLPPVLMYQFSGYRIGLYVYLELTMLVILIGAIKDKKEWSYQYLLLFCFLCVVVAVWRTESFLYIPCACLQILFVKKNIIPHNKKIVCMLLLVIGFIGANKAQNSELGNADYKVISLLGPCAELVRNADKIEDADLLADINKVVKLEVIHNNPDLPGAALYWQRGGYTDEDYNAFLHAIVKLSLKYPKVVFAERWNMFIKGSGISGLTVSNVDISAALFDENNGNSAAETVLGKGWIANSPVFKNLRKSFIYLLGSKKRMEVYM